jgi:Tol biopolymer transport system component
VRVIGGPSISPDGASIAFCTEGEDGSHLFVADLARSAARIVSGELEVRGSPAWSLDGKTITVAVDQGGEPRLFNFAVDTHEASPLDTGYAINPQWSPDGAFLIYADADAGPSFALKGMDATGGDYMLPEIKLPRAARRVAFVPGRRALIVLEGEMHHNQFWYIDLETGSRRRLTNFGREFTIRDFDIAADGREIIFDRRQSNSDLALIELH